MIKKNIFNKLVIGVVATSLITTATVGILSKNNILKSKANEEISTEANVNNEIEKSRDFYEEVSNSIKELKNQYNVEETITTKDDLKRALNSVKDDSIQISQTLASTSDAVITEIILEEYNNSLSQIEEKFNNINNAINEDNESAENVNVKTFTNGDFNASIENTDDYGIKTVYEVSDCSASTTRAWIDCGIVNEPSNKASVGARYHTYKYEMYWGKWNILSLRFRAHYNVSKNGLTSGKIVNDGSAYRMIAGTVKFSPKGYHDKTATHAGANIDGTVEFNIAGARGMNIGGVQFPSVTQFNVKVNFWITIKAMHSDGLELSYGSHWYKDQLQIFS